MSGVSFIQAKVLSFERALELFVGERKQRNYAKGTIKNYRRHIVEFFNYLDTKGITELSSVSLYQIIAYQEYLREKRLRALGREYTPETIANFIWPLKQFFRYLKKRGLILLDPAEGLPPIKKRESFPRGIMSKEEMEIILHLPDLKTRQGFRDRTILEILYSTGLRRQELINLTVTDMDLAGGFVFVEQGKGSKDRVVPLGKMAVRSTREYIEKVRPRMARGKSFPNLFLNHYGYPLSGNSVNKIIHSYVAASKINKQITCHSFRHTCATEMLKGGSSICYVQEMLGHSRLSSTQIYTRVMPIDLKRIHQKTHPREREKNIEVPAFEWQPLNHCTSKPTPNFYYKSAKIK